VVASGKGGSRNCDSRAISFGASAGDGGDVSSLVHRDSVGIGGTLSIVSSIGANGSFSTTGILSAARGAFSPFTGMARFGNGWELEGFGVVPVSGQGTVASLEGPNLSARVPTASTALGPASKFLRDRGWIAAICGTLAVSVVRDSPGGRGGRVWNRTIGSVVILSNGRIRGGAVPGTAVWIDG